MAKRRKPPEKSPPSDPTAALTDRIPAVLVDDRNRILAIGRRAVEDLGLRPDAWVGRPVDAALPRVTEPRAGDAALERRGSSRRFDGDGVAKSRRFETVEVPAGRRERWIFLIDRTEQDRARAECMHLGQLASAGRLISSIAHEINNPLSGISGYVQLLLMRDHDRETRTALEKIHSEALRSSRIVRNLLDFARRRPVVEATASFPAVLRKAIELKAHDLRVHNIAVQLDVPKSLPQIALDPHQLLQVFVNLVANAEQAMYETDRGGRITIRATPGKSDVRVVVQDTGPGISSEHRDRVFDPFFTTKAEGKGTGLGLGLCRDLLHRFGGSIHLGESADCGASFELHLPIAAANGTTPVRVRRALHDRVHGRRLLVVEDDPVCRAFVAEALESAGNEVHSFDRSDAALKFLRVRFVDAIVSDLHRPGQNGIEFHEQVKKIDDALARRILFVTGDVQCQELARFLARTGNAFLEKPILLDELHAALARLLTARPRRESAAHKSAEGAR